MLSTFRSFQAVMLWLTGLHLPCVKKNAAFVLRGWSISNVLRILGLNQFFYFESSETQFFYAFCDLLVACVAMLCRLQIIAERLKLLSFHGILLVSLVPVAQCTTRRLLS